MPCSETDYMTDNALKMPKRTTPTWEIELLLSGASVFALMQFPGWINSHFLSIQLALANNQLSGLINPLFIYVKGAAYALIITLLIHILLRAYWVSLIGLHSIHPQGLDHDKLKIGPIQKRVMDEKHGSMDDIIERADNRSTLVFAIGIGFALTILVPSVIVLAGALVAWLTWLISESEGATVLVFMAGLCLPLLALMLPLWLDAKAGARMQNWPRAHGLLERAIRRIDALGMSSTGNRLSAYFFSMQRSRNTAMAAIILGITFTLLSTALTIPRFSKVPAGGAQPATLDAAHYRDRQDGDLKYALRPSIQSETIDTEYLELRIPHPLQMPPSTVPECAQKHFPKGLKRCLSGHLRLELDGKPIRPVWIDEPARYGQPAALRAMIDLRPMKSGAHTLDIAYPPHAREPDKAWQERILFWN
ncbi:hypothetical protein [Arenimonas sp. GDDSR-1]|uniref:hypothetical protein n=1 Tax=Arenimonas sp. GDDSR-1 TaxID=2950125 RepID=UPI002634EC47|nr:hypothetical protein [Arenimonas sp. GDDSR-1]